MQIYKTIQYEHRVLISQYLKEGKKQIEIGNILGFCRSVISREVSRNSSPGSYRLYSAAQAQKRADERNATKGRKTKITGEIELKVKSYLENDWSPEQIAGRTKKEGTQLVCHETIYQYIYKDKANGGSLYIHLRQTHRTRHKRKNKTKKRGIIRDRVSISQRPAIVEERKRLGDWEGDTIIGKGHQSALVTMVDRKSKITKIIKLKEKTAKETAAQIRKNMAKSNMPILTITFDNGKEFADHKTIANGLKADVYFADPYSAFQRGTNENTNGLIRQYLPKGTDFTCCVQPISATLTLCCKNTSLGVK
jgi:IS30 family transposase